MSLMANYWAQKGWSVKIFSFDDGSTKPFFPLDPGVEYVPLAISRNSANMMLGLLNNLKRIRVLRRYICQYDPDTIISFIDRTNILTLCAVWDLNYSVLVSERTDPHMYSIGKTWNCLRRLTYRRADRIIVQSERASRYFLPNFRSTIMVIPNPISIPSEGPLPEEKLRASKMILAMGRLSEEKGFDDLLRAFRNIKDRHPEWTLTILGEGAARRSLEVLCEELGLNGRVSLPGVVSAPGGYLNRADLFVLSSRFEGFPNALCEAMACGCAVIATDCRSGPREIIRDGEDGILVPIRDVEAMAAAMDRLISNPRERTRLGRAALNGVRRYSIDRIMAMWEQIISPAA
ncbi:MAG: glycosyl transferase [Nitrospira sp.]